ncbi:retrovirus-related Pol polyprotein [Pseudoscourfieldia marina]
MDAAADDGMQLWTALKREIDITRPQHDLTQKTSSRPRLNKSMTKLSRNSDYAFALFAANVHERHQRIALELVTDLDPDDDNAIIIPDIIRRTNERASLHDRIIRANPENRRRRLALPVQGRGGGRNGGRMGGRGGRNTERFDPQRHQRRCQNANCPAPHTHDTPMCYAPGGARHDPHVGAATPTQAAEVAVDEADIKVAEADEEDDTRCTTDASYHGIGGTQQYLPPPPPLPSQLMQNNIARVGEAFPTMNAPPPTGQMYQTGPYRRTFAITLATNEPNCSKYIVDNASPYTLTGSLNHLYDVQQLEKPKEIGGIKKDSTIKCTHVGKIDFTTHEGTLTVSNAYYSAELAGFVSILSYIVMRDAGAVLVDKKTDPYILLPNSDIMFLKEMDSGHLYTELTSLTNVDEAYPTLPINAGQWHARLGHLHPRRIENFPSDAEQIPADAECPACQLHKSKRTRREPAQSVTEYKIGEVWSTDAIRPGTIAYRASPHLRPRLASGIQLRVFHTNSAKQYPSAIVHGVTTDSQGMYPSPNSMFLKRETDLNFTRIPFCVSYVYYEQHSKFQQRSNRGVLVGYSKDVPGSYVIWQPDENKTKLSAHVTCMEKLKEDGTLLHPAHIFYPELARTKVSKSACVFNIGTKIGPGGRRIAKTSVPHAPSTNLMEIGGELDTHSQKTTHSALDYAFATDVSETPDSNLARTRKPSTRKTMNDGYLPLTLVGTENEIWILVYVDDIIFASKNEQTKDIFAGHLRKKYRITEPAQLTWALGMKVSFAADGIILTQDLYVSKILERFGFTSAAKSATTPLAHGTTLTRADEEDAEARHLAQQFVGAILYAAVISRPDLSSTVRVMSHVMSKPPSNFEACKKHVLRYLSGTINRGIKYNTNSNVPLKLIGYWGESTKPRFFCTRPR